MTLRRLARDPSHRDAKNPLNNPYLVAGLLALGLTAFFYATATKTLISSDPMANALTAWTLAEHGTVVLVEHEELLSPEAYFHLTWIVHGLDGPVSLFPPGTAVLAAPAYLFGDNDLHRVVTPDVNGDPFEYGLPRIRPGIVVAAASTAIAIALLFLTLSQIGSSRGALVGALIFATATGAWSVASHSLWQHGPAMMWLGVALWAQGSPARELGWIPAILTRPLVGVFAAVRIGYEFLTERQWRKLVAPGLSATIGAGLFLLYNRIFLGSWSPLAAYEENPVLTLTSLDLGAWGRNIVGALFDPFRGLLTISPFLLVLIPGVRAGWREAPGHVRASALGALAYLLIHYKTHHYAGGIRFFGYRYPLEALLAASPLLFLSYQHWVKSHRFRIALLSFGVAASIWLQAFGILNPYRF